MKKKKANSFKTFLVSLLFSIAFILLISAILVLFLFPSHIITSEFLYDLCVKFVLFFTVVFVVSIAAVWINYRPLKSKSDKDSSLFENCDYAGAMTDVNPFIDEDKGFVTGQKLSSRMNELWEDYEESLPIKSRGKKNKKSDSDDAESDSFVPFAFEDDEEHEEDLSTSTPVVEFNENEKYRYNFEMPHRQRFNSLYAYVPFEKRIVEPFNFSRYTYYDYIKEISSIVPEPVNYEQKKIEPIAPKSYETIDEKPLFDERPSLIDDDYSIPEYTTKKEEFTAEDIEKEEKEEPEEYTPQPFVSNDGFDDAVPYIPVAYNPIPFILYEDLLISVLEGGPRPSYIAIEGVVPFKFVREREESEDKAVALGFIRPVVKEKPAQANVMNFVVSSDEGAVASKKAQAVNFVYYPDLINNVLEIIENHDDSIKSKGLVNGFKFLEKPTETILTTEPVTLTSEKVDLSSDLCPVNIMDNFFKPENVFSSENDPEKDNSPNFDDGKEVIKYSEQEKWWDDFVFIPGKEKPKAVVLEPVETKEDTHIQSESTPQVAEVEQTPEPEQPVVVQKEDFYPFVPSSHVRQDNPINPHYNALSELEDVQIAPSLKTQDSDSDDKANTRPLIKWWDDFVFIPGREKYREEPIVSSLSPYKVSSDEVEIIKDVPLFPFDYYEDLLDDNKEINPRPIGVTSNGIVPFTLYPIQKEEKENVSNFSFVSNNQPSEQKENPNNPYYNALWNLDDIEEPIDFEEDEEEILDEEEEAKAKWWDDFEFIPGKEKPKTEPSTFSLSPYKVSSDDAEITKDAPLFPFDYYEDLLSDTKEINRRPSDITPSGLVPFTLYPLSDGKEEKSDVTSFMLASDTKEREANPNNPYYDALYFAEDFNLKKVDDSNSSDNDNQDDESNTPHEKWWDDFYFVPGSAKTEDEEQDNERAENPNNPYYDAFGDADDVKLPAPFEDENSEDSAEDNEPREKWWDDFYFVPGFAKVKEEEQDNEQKENPINPYYNSFGNADDVKQPSSYTEESNDESAEDNEPREKWWDDFEYVPGYEVDTKERAKNPLDKYYAQFPEVDYYDTFVDYIYKTHEGLDEGDEPIDLINREKWWDDFEFIPGFAKERLNFDDVEERQEEAEDDTAGEESEVDEESTEDEVESPEPLTQAESDELDSPRLISLIEEEMASALDIDYPLTIARVDSDEIDKMFAQEWVDIVTYRLSEKQAVLVFIALDKKESLEVINQIKKSIDKNLRYRMSELNGRKITKREFLSEISA